MHRFRFPSLGLSGFGVFACAELFVTRKRGKLVGNPDRRGFRSADRGMDCPDPVLLYLNHDIAFPSPTLTKAGDGREKRCDKY